MGLHYLGEPWGEAYQKRTEAYRRGVSPNISGIRLGLSPNVLGIHLERKLELFQIWAKIA